MQLCCVVPDLEEGEPDLPATPVVAPLHVLRQKRYALRSEELSRFAPRRTATAGSLGRQYSGSTLMGGDTKSADLSQDSDPKHVTPFSEPLLMVTATTRRVPQGPDNLQGLIDIIWDPLCLLLICSPLGICAGVLHWGPNWTFWLNFAALIPLAKLLGDGTEEVAASLKNDTVSGLLNASFGNAVEMIVSIQALRNGLFDIVKTSLLGSILSNVLLVLGTSFLCGGLSHRTENQHTRWAVAPSDHNLVACEKEQTFGPKAALMSMGMLLFSCMSFALPTIFNEGPGDDQLKVLKVSRLGALIVMSTYLAFLIFQLVTHKTMIQQDEKQDDKGEDEEEEEEVHLSLVWAIAIMAVSTVIVSINSEFLVDALEDVVRSTGIPESFIGVILLPIAGNACEHAGAIRFAILDRPGLSIGIAVGSSTQIAMLVIPFTVIVGWAIGQGMDLSFGILNTAVMVLSVLVVLALVMDGRANWLKGYIMVAMYIFIAILYWFVPPPSMSNNPHSLPA